jgi:hypothetical protein
VLVSRYNKAGFGTWRQTFNGLPAKGRMKAIRCAMSCSHIHDFIRGTKIALPRWGSGKSFHPSEWDIVRPNKSADQMVFHHLKTLEAFKAPGRPKITKH